MITCAVSLARGQAEREQRAEQVRAARSTAR
jgi:hypothetical protein